MKKFVFLLIIFSAFFFVFSNSIYSACPDIEVTKPINPKVGLTSGLSDKEYYPRGYFTGGHYLCNCQEDVSPYDPDQCTEEKEAVQKVADDLEKEAEERETELNTNDATKECKYRVINYSYKPGLTASHNWKCKTPNLNSLTVLIRQTMIPPAGVYAPCGVDATKPWYDECMNCVMPERKYEHGGSWTALGCIPNNPRELAVWVLARAIGIGGGIAFLLMIWGGFQVITSTGDPDRLNAGKEVMTSAIAGLLLIIFSLFLLELIGVDILGLEKVGFKFGGG